MLLGFAQGEHTQIFRREHTLPVPAPCQGFLLSQLGWEKPSGPPLAGSCGRAQAEVAEGDVPTSARAEPGGQRPPGLEAGQDTAQQGHGQGGDGGSKGTPGKHRGAAARFTPYLSPSPEISQAVPAETRTGTASPPEIRIVT